MASPRQPQRSARPDAPPVCPRPGTPVGRAAHPQPPRLGARSPCATGCSRRGRISAQMNVSRAAPGYPRDGRGARLHRRPPLNQRLDDVALVLKRGGMERGHAVAVRELRVGPARQQFAHALRFGGEHSRQQRRPVRGSCASRVDVAARVWADNVRAERDTGVWWRAWGVGVGGGGRTQLLRDQVQPAPHRGLLQVARRLAKQRQQQQRQQRLARHVGATGWVGLGWGPGWGSKPLEGAGCGLERQPRSKGSSRGFSRRRQSAAAAGLTLTWSTWPLQLPSSTVQYPPPPLPELLRPDPHSTR